MGSQAITAATFLEKQIWGKTDEQRNEEHANEDIAALRKIVCDDTEMNTSEITLYEVRKTVNKTEAKENARARQHSDRILKRNGRRCAGTCKDITERMVGQRTYPGRCSTCTGRSNLQERR